MTTYIAIIGSVLVWVALLIGVTWESLTNPSWNVPKEKTLKISKSEPVVSIQEG